MSELADDLARAREARHSVGAFLDHPGRWLEQNWPSYRAALTGYLTVPRVVAGAIGLGVVIRRRQRVGLYVAGWEIVPVLAVVALADLPFVRWLLVAVPFLLVLSAVDVVEVCSALARAVAIRAPGFPGVPAAVLMLALVPAVVWDVRTLAHPTTREYPGRDDLDYVRAYSAGGPWLQLVPELERRAGGRELLVAVGDGSGTYYVETELRDTGVRLVDLSDDAAALATMGIENGSALPSGPEPLAWRPVETYERPRDGVPVTLLERGVETLDELRRAVGGVNADFDAFVSPRPPVRDWLDAWYTVHIE